MEEHQERATTELADDLTPPRRGRRPAGFATRDLTSGSIPRNLFHLSWPGFVEGLLTVVDFAVDMVWAGRISSKAIAGIGVAQMYVQLAMTGRTGIDVAKQALVSQAVGAGNIRLANHVTWQALALAGSVSVLMALVGLALTEPLLELMGVSDQVIAQATGYMRIQFVGYGGVAFRMMSGSALAAAGDTLTPMKATILSRTVHIILSPFLVFGWYGFPEWGIAGAAVANVAGQFAGAGWNFRILFTGRSRVHLRISEYRTDFRVWARLLRIGWPAILNNMERSIAQLMITKLVVPFGDFALAAFSLTRRMEMIANLGSAGVGRAAGIMVGQNLGAENTERAKQSIYWATGYVSIVKAIVGGFMLVFPVFFISIFSRDAELMEPSVVWLRIQVVSYLFMGTGQVFMFALQMAGETFFPMVLTLGSVWAVEVPLAWLLSTQTGLGQYGIAWAITIAMGVRAIGYVPYFFWGPWIHKRVVQDLSVAGERPTPRAL